MRDFILAIVLFIFAVLFLCFLLNRYPLYHKKYQQAIAATNALLNYEEQHNQYKNNIENKCGVEDKDLLWTTAMEKISNCIDRLDGTHGK